MYFFTEKTYQHLCVLKYEKLKASFLSAFKINENFDIMQSQVILGICNDCKIKIKG